MSNSVVYKLFNLCKITNLRKLSTITVSSNGIYVCFIGLNEASGPFVCKQCLRSYQVRPSLLRHQRYECNTLRCHQCSLCCKRFAHHFLLVRHMGSVHKVTGIPPAPKGRASLSYTQSIDFRNSQ